MELLRKSETFVRIVVPHSEIWVLYLHNVKKNWYPQHSNWCTCKSLTCLFSEFAASDLFLHAVASSEEEVNNIIMEAVDSFDTNRIGPYSYLKMYETYFNVLNGEAENAMMQFMKTDPFPLLKVYIAESATLVSPITVHSIVLSLW